LVESGLGKIKQRCGLLSEVCVLLGYSAETSTQYRVMDITSGRVVMARDVKFGESTLYYQLVKSPPRKTVILEPATEPSIFDNDPVPVTESPNQHPKVSNQPANVSSQHSKIHAINPIDDDFNDDLTPPPDTLEPEAPTSRVVQNDPNAPA
jgi:hypothetical protein